MNVDDDALMHENLGSDISMVLKNYANAIESLFDPDTTLKLETKLTDINGETIGKVTFTTSSDG
jgi:DNA topoisomerase IA